MSRQILFRGKTEKGEWVQGDLLQNVDCLKIREQEKNIKHIARSFQVISETVGQYTGLCDKNGKKIFDGDILDCGDRIVRVDWHKHCGTWDSIFIKYKGERCSNGIEPVEWKYRAAIIGNIHDNPELLN